MLDLYKSQLVLRIHLCCISSKEELEDKFANVAL